MADDNFTTTTSGLSFLTLLALHNEEFYNGCQTKQFLDPVLTEINLTTIAAIMASNYLDTSQDFEDDEEIDFSGEI